MKKWKCKGCGYIHTGNDAPDGCPVCCSSKSKFAENTGMDQMDLAGYLAGFFKIAAENELRHAKMLEALLKKYFA